MSQTDLDDLAIEFPGDDECGTWWGKLSLLADNELPDNEAAGVNAHLADCEFCRNSLQFMRQTSAHLRSAEQLAPPENLRDRILSATTQRRPLLAAMFPALPFRRAAAGLAGISALCAGAYVTSLLTRPASLVVASHDTGTNAPAIGRLHGFASRNTVGRSEPSTATRQTERRPTGERIALTSAAVVGGSEYPSRVAFAFGSSPTTNNGLATRSAAVAETPKPAPTSEAPVTTMSASHLYKPISVGSSEDPSRGDSDTSSKAAVTANDDPLRVASNPEESTAIEDTPYRPIGFHVSPLANASPIRFRRGREMGESDRIEVSVLRVNLK